jgi:hypothetical protein
MLGCPFDAHACSSFLEKCFFNVHLYRCKGRTAFADNQLFLIGLNLIRKADRMYW